MPGQSSSILRFPKYLLEVLPYIIFFGIGFPWLVIFVEQQSVWDVLLPLLALLACFGLLFYYSHNPTSDRLNLFHHTTHRERRILTLLRVSICATTVSLHCNYMSIKGYIAQSKKPENAIYKEHGSINGGAVRNHILFILFFCLYALVSSAVACGIVYLTWEALGTDKGEEESESVITDGKEEEKAACEGA